MVPAVKTAAAAAAAVAVHRWLGIHSSGLRSSCITTPCKPASRSRTGQATRSVSQGPAARDSLAQQRQLGCHRPRLLLRLPCLTRMLQRLHSQRGGILPQMQQHLSRPQDQKQSCHRSGLAAKKDAQLLWPAPLCWAPSCSASGPVLPRLCLWVCPAAGTSLVPSATSPDRMLMLTNQP